MKTSALLLLLVAGMFADFSHAQTWTVYDPAERDFRVLFPAVPQRSTDADGSVVFSAKYENDEDSILYTVYRLPSTVQRVDDKLGEVRRRLEARASDEVRYVREEDDGPDWERLVFRYRGIVSVHRLVGAPGRYYELEVRMPRGTARVAMNTARDFFNTFQTTGFALPTIASIGIAIGQKVDAWCASRTDPFSRAFCEYSVCIQPGYEKYPHCTALLRR